MRTRPILVFVAALGLFAGFSCAAHSREGTPTGSKAQSGNSNAAGDEKKVSVSAGSNSVEVKSADGKSVSISAGGIEVSKADKDSAKLEVSADDVVKISGVNQNVSDECKGRSFTVEGTSNTVKLTGQCQNLKVSGTSNRVEVETVAAINVSGIRNQVTWEHGVNKKPPRIANSGINNTVSEKGN